jgi:hypothetical protein
LADGQASNPHPACAGQILKSTNQQINKSTLLRGLSGEGEYAKRKRYFDKVSLFSNKISRLSQLAGFVVNVAFYYLMPCTFSVSVLVPSLTLMRYN